MALVARLLRISLALLAFGGQGLLFSSSLEESGQQGVRTGDSERRKFFKWGGAYRLRGENQRGFDFRGYPHHRRKVGITVVAISCDQSLESEARPMPSTVRLSRRFEG